MASRGINKVILLGRVGQQPEFKPYGGNDGMASFSLATTESWRDRSTGQLRDKTEWHRISVFGQTASFCSTYVTKGSLIYVEGQLETRSWQDRNGQTKYTTEVVVRWPLGKVQLLGDGDKTSSRNNSPDVSSNNTPDYSGSPFENKKDVMGIDESWDDIPF